MYKVTYKIKEEKVITDILWEHPTEEVLKAFYPEGTEIYDLEIVEVSEVPETPVEKYPLEEEVHVIEDVQADPGDSGEVNSHD